MKSTDFAHLIPRKPSKCIKKNSIVVTNECLKQNFVSTSHLLYIIMYSIIIINNLGSSYPLPIRRFFFFCDDTIISFIYYLVLNYAIQRTTCFNIEHSDLLGPFQYHPPLLFELLIKPNLFYK